MVWENTDEDIHVLAMAFHTKQLGRRNFVIGTAHRETNLWTTHILQVSSFVCICTTRQPCTYGTCFDSSKKAFTHRKLGSEMFRSKLLPSVATLICDRDTRKQIYGLAEH